MNPGTSHRSRSLPPAAHRLLVATPMLEDPEFAGTVLYLLEHDDTGSLGVILNRPSHTPVGHVLPDWEDTAGTPAVVFNGGPVQRDGALGLGRLVAGFDSGAGRTAVRAVTTGLALIDLDAPVAEVAADTSAIRVYAGHSGWAVGQLAAEIAEGAWFVVDSQVADVFSADPEQLWHDVLRRQPPPLSLWSSYPKDPSLN